MSETKTVSPDSTSLYVQQCEDVALMRSSLLSFNRADPLAAKKAIQNITILRVYHQISRIIRYTTLMDKLEDKMYESIEMSLQEMDPCDDTTWKTLATLQEKLQRSMIDSHKLLEPYLDFTQLSVIETTQEQDPTQSFNAIIFDKESREKLRTSAQEVLALLDKPEEAPADDSK